MARQGGSLAQARHLPPFSGIFSSTRFSSLLFPSVTADTNLIGCDLCPPPTHPCAGTCRYPTPAGGAWAFPIHPPLQINPSLHLPTSTLPARFWELLLALLKRHGHLPPRGPGETPHWEPNWAQWRLHPPCVAASDNTQLLLHHLVPLCPRGQGGGGGRTPNCLTRAHYLGRLC